MRLFKYSSIRIQQDQALQKFLTGELSPVYRKDDLDISQRVKSALNTWNTLNASPKNNEINSVSTETNKPTTQANLKNNNKKTTQNKKMSKIAFPGLKCSVYVIYYMESYSAGEKDPETGYAIRHPIDYSGKNHIYLNDHAYKSDTYLMVHESFTTSPSPLNGNKLVFIDSITLEGQGKYQYFPVYPKPLVIKIEHTAGMGFTTMFLPSPAKLDSLLAEARKLKAIKKYIKNAAK